MRRAQRILAAALALASLAQLAVAQPVRSILGLAMPQATATSAGAIVSGLEAMGRTTAPASVPIGGITLLGAGLMPSVVVSVPGILAGDFVVVAFAGAAPSNMTIAAAQVIADGQVRITPAATSALTLGSSSVSLNFAWFR